MSSPSLENFRSLADEIKSLPDTLNVDTRAIKMTEIVTKFLLTYQVEYRDGCKDGEEPMYTAILISVETNVGMSIALTPQYERIAIFDLIDFHKREFPSNVTESVQLPEASSQSIPVPVKIETGDIAKDAQAEYRDGKIYLTFDSDEIEPRGQSDAPAITERKDDKEHKNRSKEHKGAKEQKNAKQTKEPKSKLIKNKKDANNKIKDKKR